MASEFDRVLNQFRRSMLEYKVTGQPIFKQQADVARKWLTDYFNTMKSTIQRDTDFIDKFAKQYARTNPELTKYKKEIANARTKGPELQDVYEGEKETQEEPSIDETSFYTKAAAVGGILAIGAVLSFL
jgi:lysyl-tRNA synthetase class I